MLRGGPQKRFKTHGPFSLNQLTNYVIKHHYDHKLHQRKQFEGHSHRSRHLIAFLFSSAATMARPGCGDQYAGLAEGNGDKENIDGSLEPPVYML